MRPYLAARRGWIFPIALGVVAAALAAGAYFFVNGSLNLKPAGPPEKVTIAYSATTDSALAIVAQMRGYYREEGLETTARLHTYGKLALQDVLEGKADFATVAETPVMFATMKGEEISILATIQVTSQNNAIIARRDRGIGTFGDLRGRKIAATLGTTSDYFLDAILAVQGISRKDITVIDLKAEEIPAALARGEIDAASAFPPYLVLAQKQLGESVVTFYDKDIYTWTFNIAAQREFIHRNPETVKKMLRALVRAEEFVSRQPAEAQKIVAAFSGIDVAVIRATWAGSEFAVTLDQSLLLAMEDEAKWAIKNRLVGDGTKIPNYLDYIYLDGLASVKPKAINILR